MCVNPLRGYVYILMRPSLWISTSNQHRMMIRTIRIFRLRFIHPFVPDRPTVQCTGSTRVCPARSLGWIHVALRTDRTEACPSWPIRQARTDDRARINFERTDSDSDRSFSFLVRLGRTACTDGRTNGLTDYFDPIFEFDHQEFSKATILKLSDDLGHIWSSSVREKLHSGRTDCPAHVLALTAGCAAEYIESGQK